MIPNRRFQGTICIIRLCFKGNRQSHRWEFRQVATDAAKDVSFAISIRVMPGVELIPIQSLEMIIFTD